MIRLLASGFVVIASLLAELGFAAMPQAESARTNLPLLTNARQVHQLTSEQAAQRYPVQLRAVVTFCDEAIGQLFVQDETGGIFVEIAGDYGFRLHTGQLLLVEGVSVPGGFAPDVEPRSIQLLGTRPLPPARPVAYEQMGAGQEDCNWVEFSGIVRWTGPDASGALGLKLAGGGGRVMVPIKNADLESCLKLVDSEVSIQGVCIAHFNRKGQLIQVAIQVPTMDHIRVRNAAPSEPFAARTRMISNLLQYVLGEQHGHRVKVKGIVTLQRPGESLFIADDTQGLYIQTTQTTPVTPGDRVEALGFPDAGEYVSPILQDAVFRKLGNDRPLTPLRIAADDAARDTNHAALIQIDARILNRVERRKSQLLELQSGTTIFDAELGSEAAGLSALRSIPDGSRVLVTGVCVVPEVENWLSPRPHSFSLLLRSAADVALVESPSWWTAQHALWVLGATLAVFGASLAWVLVLRSQVKVQTRIIAQKIQREAALEERSRIARDLHDDLGASLTQIGFLSQVAQKEQQDPAAVEEHLREISGSAQEAFRSLDEIVWVVNPRNDTLENLANYLCHFTDHFFQGTSTKCRFDVPTDLPNYPILTELRNNLFLAAKEALNNIRKHAGATEVSLRIRVNGSVDSQPAGGAPAAQSARLVTCSISVEDNGRGFNAFQPDGGRNGLVNMRQRLESVGGNFLLESQPGAGTKVRLTFAL